MTPDRHDGFGRAADTFQRLMSELYPDPAEAQARMVELEGQDALALPELAPRVIRGGAGGGARSAYAANVPASPNPSDALTGVEIFAALEHDVRQRVVAAALPRTYRKGQLLFVENDPGESLIVLKRGAVVVFRTAPTGERAVLTVMRPPEVLGELSLLNGEPRSLSAEAIEDCHALALSRGAFLELVRANPRILEAVMRSLGRLIRRLTEQNADHVFLDLPGRVAKTLVRLAGDTDAPTVTIGLSQGQLAEMAGGSRQSVNQAIGSFANRGWLRTEGRQIVVTDLRALRRRAGMADQ